MKDPKKPVIDGRDLSLHVATVCETFGPVRAFQIIIKDPQCKCGDCWQSSIFFGN